MAEFSYDQFYTPPGSPAEGGGDPTAMITNQSMGYNTFGPPITSFAGGGQATMQNVDNPYSGRMSPPSGGMDSPFGFQTGYNSNLAGMGAEARFSGDEAMRQAAMLRGGGANAANMMDPFAPYRGAFAKQLMQLQANPSSITSMPGYQAGLEGVQRAMAAQGFQGSGNMMAGLAKYSGNFFNQTMDRLAGFAGAGATPGAGAGLYMQGLSQGADLTGQGLASRGYAAELGY